MLKNTQINRIIIKTIAKALGDLNKEVVYVGGAVVSLYIDDTAAEDIRPTKDIDISLEITSLTELETLRASLEQKGFTQSYEELVNCRFLYDDIKLDVMATKAVGWAPANKWFAPGFKSAKQVDIDGTSIRILALPYFLATKFTAFYNRGGKDPRFSHDFEDIVYILNHTSDIKTVILTSGSEVKKFLKEAFSKILDNALLKEAIRGHLFYEDQDIRFNSIINTLSEITSAIK